MTATVHVSEIQITESAARHPLPSRRLLPSAAGMWRLELLRYTMSLWIRLCNHTCIHTLALRLGATRDNGRPRRTGSLPSTVDVLPAVPSTRQSPVWTLDTIL